MVSDYDIASVLESNSTVKEKVETLIGLANEAGGADNITAVLVEI